MQSQPFKQALKEKKKKKKKEKKEKKEKKKEKPTQHTRKGTQRKKFHEEGKKEKIVPPSPPSLPSPLFFFPTLQKEENPYTFYSTCFVCSCTKVSPSKKTVPIGAQR
eukprot:TRINITY_DN1892_c0_g1_i7.p1 TRINITY_DN1892_c0_g1~~TRINITY_DN1892_c0_g1_i7.p1  ORF type:complete len:107 (+),score=37.97 TRINITY_DN1892_c0_g1_i7:472-792(+)